MRTIKKEVAMKTTKREVSMKTITADKDKKTSTAEEPGKFFWNIIGIGTLVKENGNFAVWHAGQRKCAMFKWQKKSGNFTGWHAGTLKNTFF